MQRTRRRCPRTPSPGTYLVSLVVNDGFDDSEPDNVTITAISIQDAVTDKLEEVLEVIRVLPPGSFKNPRLRRRALPNKVNSVLDKIDQGLFQEAIDKIVHDILAKTDGCDTTGQPDRNDWIVECSAQLQLYPLLIEAIELLEEFL